VTGNIDSDAFRNAFNLLLRLMLADWNMDDAEVDRVRNLLPNRLTNTDKEQLLTFLLCMIHGIETVHADADAGNWEYKQNGRTVDHARIQNMLKVYYKDRPGEILAKATAVMHLLTKSYDDATGSLLDLRYNLHILQKPAFEVPNPLILSSILRNLSHSHVSFNAEGAVTTDKNDAHNFKTQFFAYIDADKDLFATQVTVMRTIVEEFFEMYDRQASNLFLVNQLLSASTYIQNNQTELPAMAYHGNMKIDKIKGGQEEVRCVGHLGNSFPGCACIREGKGMVNTYERMPTAVHVM
jgi:uncharacterized tellurite resistance protein B-like protein